MSKNSKFLANHSCESATTSTVSEQEETQAVAVSSPSDLLSLQGGELVTQIPDKPNFDDKEENHRAVLRAFADNLFDDFRYFNDLPFYWDRLFRSCGRIQNNPTGNGPHETLGNALKLADFVHKAPKDSGLKVYTNSRNSPWDILSITTVTFRHALKPLKRDGRIGYRTNVKKLKNLDTVLRDAIEKLPEKSVHFQVVVVRMYAETLLKTLLGIQWWRCDGTVDLEGFPFPPATKGPDLIHLEKVSPAQELSELLTIPPQSSNGKKVMDE